MGFLVRNLFLCLLSLPNLSKCIIYFSSQKMSEGLVLDYKVRVLQLHHLSELQLHVCLCSYLALASI